ncbi:MAG TPA: malate dehydrogenase [Chloroflexota bacterium]|nr:malate dehydrogenase [Chloroflexota bacterium]
MKLTMIGAGRVGTTTVFELQQEGGFTEIVLLDIMEEKAWGEALDFRHGASRAPRCDISAHGKDYAASRDSDMIIITAGIPRAPGQSRLDLLKANVEAMGPILAEVGKVNRNAILLMVANPVDVLTYQAVKALGWPADRVFGLGNVLDTVRFRSLLAERLGVHGGQISVYMLGEHGDSMQAVTANASVAGIPLKQFPGYSDEILKDVIEQTRIGGAEVIRTKGGTFYAVAPSICWVVQSVLRDSKEILPISSLLTGQHGISNICVSLPCVVGAGGRERVLEIPLTGEELAGVQNSARILRESADAVGLR